MPYTTVIIFVAYDPLAAADLNSNFGNLDYLNGKINEQIQVLGASMMPSGTNGAAYGTVELSTNKINLRAMDFSDSGGKLYAEFGFMLPSDYSSGSTITARFIWTADSTSTNSVVWGLQAFARSDTGAMDTTFGTAQEVTDANGNATYTLRRSDATAAITIANTPAAGKWCQCRVYRDSGNASDDLAATARLLAVVITYTRA